MAEEIKSLEQFHGHLGPYVVIGYRMGKLALSMLEARGKKLSVVVCCGLKPPESCMIDGIQFATCCTLGKGNICVKSDGLAEAVFTGEKKIRIKLREAVREEINAEGASDRMVSHISGLSDGELFEVETLG